MIQRSWVSRARLGIDSWVWGFPGASSWGGSWRSWWAPGTMWGSRSYAGASCCRICRKSNMDSTLLIHVVLSEIGFGMYMYTLFVKPKPIFFRKGADISVLLLTFPREPVHSRESVCTWRQFLTAPRSSSPRRPGTYWPQAPVHLLAMPASLFYYEIICWIINFMNFKARAINNFISQQNI